MNNIFLLLTRFKDLNMDKDDNGESIILSKQRRNASKEWMYDRRSLIKLFSSICQLIV